jgi:hypothetical protein
VKNKPTGHISASLTPEAAEIFDSNNGMIEIDIRKATGAGGATFIDHGNVMQAVNSRGSLEDRKNAKRAEEVLFKGPVPTSAIRRRR